MLRQVMRTSPSLVTRVTHSSGNRRPLKFDCAGYASNPGLSSLSHDLFHRANPVLHSLIDIYSPERVHSLQSNLYENLEGNYIEIHPRKPQNPSAMSLIPAVAFATKTTSNNSGLALNNSRTRSRMDAIRFVVLTDEGDREWGFENRLVVKIF